MRRRELLLATGALGAWPLGASAQSFPSRAITLYCPFPAGGPTDLMFRALAEAAGRSLGQSVIVENRPGAAGTLTAPTMRTARPDGYTLTQCPMGMFRVPHMQRVQTFDPLKDFTYIINLTGYTFGMVVRADSPLKSVADVVAYAKVHPGMLTYGSTGIGAGPHLAMDEFASRAGIDIVHVPYKGSSDMLPALLGGHVMVGTDTTGWAPHVDGGKMRLLATYGSQRTKRWPEVPTLKELGYGVASDSPFGIVGPAGMDAAVVKVLHDSFRTALAAPKVVEMIDRYDQPTIYMNSADYAEWAKKTHADEARTIARLGLKNSL